MKQINLKFLILTALIVSFAGITACTANRSDSADSSAKATSTNVPVSGSESAAQTNSEQESVSAEKEKLEKERAKLEKEKQNLKDEKAKMEKMKDAAPPASEVTNNVTTLDPPSNIRDSPNGKILCTVKKQATWLKIYGSTGISDNNGEWFYTKHCGKLGVIHSSQFVSPG